MTTAPQSVARSSRPLLLLLDSHAIVHRAYHALPPLTTAEGVQTNAVYGFTTTLFAVMERFQPTHIVAAFDAPGPTFRKELYADYKATRKATPEDLAPQFALVRDVVDALGIVRMEQPGFEADDVIGTVARNAANAGMDVVIVTGDKDTLQLVNAHVTVFTMSRGVHDMVLYDVATVRDKTGLAPSQMTDYKGLRGDSSDNIPGVKGVGEKTAVTLLAAYHDLDGVYAHLDDVAPGVRAKLVRDKAQAYLSKELGTIRTDVPIGTVDYASARVDHITYAAARALFQRLHFTSLLKRLPRGDADVSSAQATPPNTHRVVTEADAAATLRNATKTPHILVVDASDGVVHGVALLPADARDSAVVYVPHTPQTHAALARYCADPQAHKVCFDGKSVMHMLGHAEMTMAGIVDDVMLAAYVVQQTQKYDFASLLFAVTGRAVTQRASTEKQMALGLRDDARERVATCVTARDVCELYRHFRAAVDATVATQRDDANVRRVLADVELPLVPILYAMEREGIAIDKERFNALAEMFDEEIAQLTDHITAVAGKTFNINSPQQLAQVLFDVLRLPTDGIKKNKTGYSTASDELAKIRNVHPIVEAVERYRELFKLKTTYVDVLPHLADHNGRIHTTFNQAVTATGRLSSSEPNLQNIPIRTKDGRRLREGFVARDGFVLVSADYSQIDLRCVAHMSGDPAMIAAFRDGADIHAYTAARVLGKDVTDVAPHERRSAKELNFGLIYGMGRFGFARAAGIDQAHAEEFIAAYFERFAGVKKYLEETKKAAKAAGYVETLLGRRRYVPEITSKSFQLRAAGERIAVNMPIQGLAADIMKLAMIASDAWIRSHRPRGEVSAVLQVHDEILFEVRAADAAQFAKDIATVMEGVYTLDVPLVVETAIGTRWSEL